MKIVIIIPTYNERLNIEKMIPLLEQDIFPKVKNHHLSILIVDDNSPDDTAKAVKEFQKKWHNIELLTGEKKGLGSAYVRGMKYAMEHMNADAVMEFDSDFQHNPHDIPRLIKAMDEGADYVIGSRYIPGGSIPKEWGLDRKILSVFGNLFTQLVWVNFKIHDMTSGFKLTKTSFLKRVDLNNLFSNNFAYKMQILHDVVKLHARVTEVPIVFLEREQGKSKINIKDQFESLYVVLRLGIADRIRVIKFLIVGGTGFVVQIILQEFSYFSGFATLMARWIFPLVQIFSHSAHIIALSNGVAAGIGAEAAIISNFILNNVWTFKDRKHQGFLEVLHNGLKFNVASLASVIIQFAAITIGVLVFGDTVFLFSHHIPTRDVILIPTIIILVIPMNYVIYNRVIWKKQQLKK